MRDSATQARRASEGPDSLARAAGLYRSPLVALKSHNHNQFEWNPTTARTVTETVGMIQETVAYLDDPDNVTGLTVTSFDPARHRTR